MKAVIETTLNVRERVKKVAKTQGVPAKDIATMILDDGLGRFERGEVVVQKETTVSAVPVGSKTPRKGGRPTQPAR